MLTEVQIEIFKVWRGSLVQARWPGWTHWTLGLSSQERPGWLLGPPIPSVLVGFLHVLNECNTTWSFSWSCVLWSHLPLPVHVRVKCPLWVLKCGVEGGLELGVRIKSFLKSVCGSGAILFTSHGDHSIQLYPPTVYWVIRVLGGRHLGMPPVSENASGSSCSIPPIPWV